MKELEYKVKKQSVITGNEFSLEELINTVDTEIEKMIQKNLVETGIRKLGIKSQKAKPSKRGSMIILSQEGRIATMMDCIRIDEVVTQTDTITVHEYHVMNITNNDTYVVGVYHSMTQVENVLKQLALEYNNGELLFKMPESVEEE